MKLNFHFQIFQLKQFENLKKILECNCCIIYFFLFQNRKRLEDFIINSDINIHCINKNYTHVTQNHNKKRFTLGIPENRIKRGETLHMHIPFQIFFKSTNHVHCFLILHTNDDSLIRMFFYFCLLKNIYNKWV
jgi:hypothetical protein